MQKKYVIIGSSAAGIGAINTLRQLDAHASIICVSDEAELPYNKCIIADYVSGIKSIEQVYTFSPEKAAAKNVVFMLGKRVAKINPAAQKIILENGHELPYDALFIGTGASPIWPALEGLKGLSGVFSFHGLRDAQAIMAYVNEHKPRKALIIGSGLSGLECADALLSHNIEVTVVERTQQILPYSITRECSSAIERAMTQQGVQFLNNQEVARVFSKNGQVTHVHLKDGTSVDTDMVIVAIGSKPNAAIAQEAGLTLAGNAIAVDDSMKTSDPAIYAGGDVVMVKNQLTGHLVQSRTWPDAMLQGMIAAHTMAGSTRLYPGIAPVLSSAFFGLKFAQCGATTNLEPDHQLIAREVAQGRHTLVFHQERLKGFCLIGDISTMSRLKRALLTGELVAPERLFGGL